MGFLNKLKGEEPLFVPVNMIMNGEKLNLGNTDEYLISYALENSVKERNVIYRNLLVPKRRSGETTEVDVLMLTERGVYVFESKNYSGWIFGSANQRQWTMCLNKSTKERFFNPIMQNKGHLSALAHELDLPEDAFTSLIVFSERCELKKVPDDTEKVVICRRHRVASMVIKHLKRNPYRLLPEEFESTKQKLDSLAAASTAKARKAHAQRMKEKHS